MSNFRRLTITVFSTLIFLVLAFLLLNLSKGLTVRKTEIDTQNLEQSLVTIFFNRPLASQEPSDFIEISPATEYKSNIVGSKVSLQLTSVSAGTEYTITLKSGIKDIYGKSTKKDKLITFKTRTHKIAYLDKHVGDSSDYIMSNDVTLKNPTTLFEHPNIVDFTIRGDYLAAIINESNIDQLALIDLRTKKQTTVSKSGEKVSQVVFAQRSKQIFFLSQNVEVQDGFEIPLSGKQLAVYDIVKEERYPLDLTAVAEDIQNFTLSGNDSQILFRSTADDIYYTAFVNDLTSPNAIGKYFASSGFNKNGQSLMFLDVTLNEYNAPYIVKIDADGKLTTITKAADFSIDPQFASDNSIIYSQEYSEYPDTKGLFEIVIEKEGQLLKVREQNGKSLELPLPSSDSKYILATAFSGEQMLDYTFYHLAGGFLARPYSGEIVLYDVQNQTLIQNNISGALPKWY